MYDQVTADLVRDLAAAEAERDRCREAMKFALGVIQNVQHGNRYRPDDPTLAQVADMLSEAIEPRRKQASP